VTDADKRSEIMDGKATVPEHVVFRSFEAETLLLNLETGQYHGLNVTGGRMLELLRDTDGDVRESVARLAAEYEADEETIGADMADFCLALEERGLLQVERG
jgi:Coenzyme PQQ synthesis protein D (PqqD)